MKQGLILGRFQPLCSNHTQFIAEVLTHVDQLLIGVGQINMKRAKEVLDESQQGFYQQKYLFSYETVVEWIQRKFPDANIVFAPVQDIFDANNYEEHVKHCFANKGVEFDDITLYGENKETFACFSIQKERKVILYDKHASDIRRQIYKTGNTEGVEVELNNKQLETIVKSERIKEFLEKGATIKHEGYLTVVNQPHGDYQYDVVVSPDAVVGLYIDPEDKVWFTRQYRVPVGKEILELPAETLDKPGKTPLEHIYEGFIEECGIEVDKKNIEYVMTVGSTEGHDSEYVHLFKAKGPHTYVGQRLEDSENITVEKIPFTQAYEMMKEGKINGSKTAILLQEEYISRMK